jgi:hypothetical protein
MRTYDRDDEEYRNDDDTCPRCHGELFDKVDREDGHHYQGCHCGHIKVEYDEE